jgi:hypothetical protein
VGSARGVKADPVPQTTHPPATKRSLSVKGRVQVFFVFFVFFVVQDFDLW